MNKNSRLILSIAFAVLVIGGAIAWKMSGTSVAETVRNWMIQTASRSLNGSLSVGEVDFSFSGSLVAKQVLLKDKTGALVASAKTLAVDFDISDLLSRRFDVSRVRNVKVDELVLNLDRNKEKIWNASTVLKSTGAKASSPEPASIFRGKVVATNSTVTITTPETRYVFNNLEGTLDFAKYPEIAMDLKSKQGASVLAAKGAWNFSAGGNVAITAESIEPSAFSLMTHLKGLTTVQAVLAGTTDKPTARGSFKIPAGNLGTLTFSNASGDFTFADNILHLVNAKANALGGAIQANGSIYPDTLRYVQKVSGQNIDSSQLSDKDIQGRLDFNSDVQGQGDWDGASADGTFNMGSGRISGISFDSLTGNFSKRGVNIRYYNLTAKIAGQTIYIGDADSLNSLKLFFSQPTLPGLPGIPGFPGTPAAPAAPRAPTTPGIPKLPSLPKLF